jgi:predicted regulator of Ras-like GTPase activity (Roadblock/LC7/MglB family)
MPVSSLTVEPVIVPKPAPVIALRPEPSLKPDPTLKPDPVLAPKEPAIALRPEPITTPEPAITPKAERPATRDSLIAPPAPTRSPVESTRAPAAPTGTTPADGAAAVLAQFTAMDGVQWAVLADREGFVVEATANAGVDADVAAALSACLAEASDGLGRELGRGTLHGVILEYEKGIVVIYGAGAGGLLAVGLSEASVLGKVRYFAKKALPELTRAI